MLPSPTTLRLIRFRPFEVDPKSQELYKDGARIKLQHQPFHILSMLLEHPGEVVTREELRQALWPSDTFVDFDQGLNKAVNKLREALCDSAEHPDFIETLPKCGYRFIAHVDAGVSPRRRWWGVYLAVAGFAASLALAALDVAGLRHRLLAHAPGRHAAVSSKIESIAVLPLENLSHDPTQDSIADGVTDTLITDLGKIPSLRVISRQSTIHYKQSEKPLPEIARELNVEVVVDGTVQRSGNRLRINIQLVQATTDRHLWAKTYERQLENLLAIEDEVARDVADQIKASLAPSAGTNGTARVP